MVKCRAVNVLFHRRAAVRVSDDTTQSAEKAASTDQGMPADGISHVFAGGKAKASYLGIYKPRQTSSCQQPHISDVNVCLYG